jgi:hypothetical protein
MTRWRRWLPGDAVSLDLSTSARVHSAFDRIWRVHSGLLEQPLGLVRFYDRARRPSGQWWTDCGEGRSLETIGQARKRLALRDDWGAYDGRVEYTVPKRRDVLYVQDTVAWQCKKASARAVRNTLEAHSSTTSLKGSTRGGQAGRAVRNGGRPDGRAWRYTANASRNTAPGQRLRVSERLGLLMLCGGESRRGLGATSSRASPARGSPLSEPAAVTQ